MTGKFQDNAQCTFYQSLYILYFIQNIKINHFPLWTTEFTGSYTLILTHKYTIHALEEISMTSHKFISNISLIYHTK